MQGGSELDSMSALESDNIKIYTFFIVLANSQVGSCCCAHSP